MDQETRERLDFLEFRQELLFEDTSFNRFLFETKVTKEEYRNILDLFESLREQIGNGNEVSSSSYESRIYEIVPNQAYNYHFAEGIAQTLHENGRWEEVFVELYKNSPKFKQYILEYNNK
ncbi:DUF1878 domain-containing protein [Guptibacillus hwajinpoensis]|uniref:DUF1878 domain-containing protein n=1 Tax=Guptibacillus hwajinpoensis TaxID=208199 RepID=UPI00351085E0